VQGKRGQGKKILLKAKKQRFQKNWVFEWVNHQERCKVQLSKGGTIEGRNEESNWGRGFAIKVQTNFWKGQSGRLRSKGFGERVNLSWKGKGVQLEGKLGVQMVGEPQMGNPGWA